MSRRDLIVAWFAPLVLIVVALHQLYHATAGELTSWKGGGFGMFASVDSATNRAVRGAFVTPDGPVPIDVHGLSDLARSDEKAFVNARALPDERRMRSLAHRIRLQRWVLQGGVARVDERRGSDVAGGESAGLDVLLLDAPDGGRVPVTRLELEVYGVAYTRGTPEIEPRLLATYVEPHD